MLLKNSSNSFFKCDKILHKKKAEVNGLIILEEITEHFHIFSSQRTHPAAKSNEQMQCIFFL